jgi:hypothetical protein
VITFEELFTICYYRKEHHCTFDGNSFICRCDTDTRQLCPIWGKLEGLKIFNRGINTYGEKASFQGSTVKKRFIDEEEKEKGI